MKNDLPNIWYMQTERDVRGLIAALKHQDPQVRRRAAAALRVVGALNAAPALQAALNVEQDADARLALVSALDYLTPQQRQPQQPRKRPQTRVERLIQHLTGPRPDLSLQAAESLGKLHDLSAVPALVIVFRNRRQPANVRLAAARALLAMNSAPAEVTLLGALQSEKWHLRRNGAAILGRLEADWAVEPLSRALYDPNDLVARTARAALRRIGTPEARQALEDAKHAIIDTVDAIDPKVVEKAQHVKQEKERLGNQVTMQIDRDKISNYLEKQRKQGTSDLKPPATRPQTGKLKAPVVPAQAQPEPAAPPNKASTNPVPPAKPSSRVTPPRKPVSEKTNPGKPSTGSPEKSKSTPGKPANSTQPKPPEKTASSTPLPGSEVVDRPARPVPPASTPREKSRRRKSSTSRLTDPNPEKDE